MTTPVSRRLIVRRLTVLEMALLAFTAGMLTVSRASWGHLNLAAVIGGLALVVAFALVEMAPLHLEWSGQAYSLSLSEVPLVIGLLWWPSPLLVVARVLGGAFALAVHRRQPLQKLVFNLCNQACEVSLALAVFLAVPGHGGPDPLVATPAILVAVVLSTGQAMGAVGAVIWLTVGRVDRAVVQSFWRNGLIGLVVNPSVALIVATAERTSHWTTVPLFVVLVGGGAVYRAYVRLRQQHATLGTLYEFTRGLHHNSTTEGRMRDLLERTRDMLKAESAGVLLADGEPDEPPTLCWIDAGGALQSEIYVAGPADWPFARVLSAGSVCVLPRVVREPGVQEFLAHRDMRDAILAPLVLDGERRGVLYVQDRTGDVATFTGDDARLFETVAAHVASVLDNSRLVDRLRHESAHDALTGLANRQHFRTRLVGTLRTSSAPFAVLLADLDRFKEINDTLGHHHGDLLIREIATRITAAAPPRSVVSRLGGDEFALLLPGAGVAEAVAVAADVRAAVSAPCVLDGVALDVDISIGVAAAPEHGLDDTVLLKRADMAMYAAKAAGTGVEVYDASRDDYSPRRLALATELRTAIANDELTVSYQPQVDATGVPVAVEALVRWQHREYGAVSPSEFVPLAEQSGAVVQLTEWVLERSLEQLAAWHAEGLMLHLSVNVSMRNLLDADIVDTVRDGLRRVGVAPSYLTLEITESHIMSDPARTQSILESFAAIGVRIAIDDFGTGYSSLSYLRQLPVHEVKIDKSFVVDLMTNDNSGAIVAAILSVASTLGLETVAEGVEDEATLNALATMGCTRQQGFHIARPTAPSELTPWLRAHMRSAMARTSSSVVPLRGLPSQRRGETPERAAR